MNEADETRELLTRFVADRSEAAFRRLIETHTGMVHAVARRKLNGNDVQAREVTQAVFAELARRAAALPRSIVLSAWLHRVTCTQAAMLIRSETRRRKHEANAAAMITSEQSGEEETGWNELSPVLDDELNRLSSSDRVALVLRFFDRRGLREVGTALGTTEEGARKRVTRALEKLRARFVRRGLAVPGSSGLAVLLTSKASDAAVPGLTEIVARGALAPSSGVPAGFASGAITAVIFKGAAVAAVAALGFAGGRASAPPPVASSPVVVLHPAPPPIVAPVVQAAPPPVPPPASSLIGLAASTNAMLDRIARATVPELAAIFDEYHHDLTTPLFDLLCQRWASLDSAAALKHLRRKDTSVDRFFGAWAKANFQTALRLARAEPGGWKRDSVQAVLASLLPQDPQAFLTVAAGEKASHVSPASVDLAIRTIADGDIKRALEVLANLKAPHLREFAVRTIAALQAASDPDAALAWAKSLSAATERDAALRSALCVMAAADPDATVPHLSLIESTGRGDDPVWIAVHAMMKQDQLRGLKWAAENFPAHRLEAATSFLQQADEVSAVERLRISRRMRERLAASGTAPFALKMFDDANKRSLVVSSNPIADIQSLAAETPDKIRDQWLQSVASLKLRRESSDAVTQLLQSLPADAAAVVAPRVLSLVKNDAAALSVVLPMLEGHPRALSAFRSLGEEIAVSSMQEAQAALAKFSGPSQTHVAYGIAGGWAARDPDAALTWAESLPGPARAGAIEAIASKRAAEDEFTTSEWIDSLPRGVERDAATRGLCSHLAKSEPDSAWIWATAIADPDVRLEVTSAVFYEWRKKDRSAATSALQGARLSAAVRRSVEQFKPERSWYDE